jgi:hypothetical protein
MGGWPFKLQNGAPEYMSKRFDNLIATDNIRLMQVLELIQYSFLYFIVAFFAGTTMDNIFPDYEPKETSLQMIIEVLAQSILTIIVAFYIRKLVKIIPFAFVLKGSKFVPGLTTEYHGDMMIGAIVFVSVQVNLLRKINELGVRSYNQMTGKNRPDVAKL